MSEATMALEEEKSPEPPQEEEAEAEAEDDYEVEFVQPFRKLQRPNGLSVPELLAIRQGYGVSALALPPFARPRSLMTTTLASKVAWNPARLQNMILTVGPGTPAAVVDLTVEPRAPVVARRLLEEPSIDTSSSSSSPDDDDDEIEGEGEEEEEEEEEQEETPPNATHSRSESSASSTSTTSPKRTLSDRMKPQEDEEDTTKKHDMNLSTTSGDEDEDEKEEVEEKSDSKQEEEDKGKEDEGKEDKSPEEESEARDEEMMGYSDAEGELAGKDTDKDADMENQTDRTELETLTDRERFSLEINQAEEHRMQFSEESNDEDDEEDLDEDEHQRPPGGLVETTDEDGEDDLAEDDEEMADFREMAAEWFAEQAEEEEESADDDDDNDDDDSGDEEEEAAARIIIRRRIIERSISPTRNRNGTTERTMKPSLRHGGCINTAAWLQAGWRLSTVSSDDYSSSYNANGFELGDSSHIHAISSDDCPTQLVTSGDDRLVKFWDVRHAMGSSNPLPWGRNTHCPFAYTPDCDDTEGVGYKYKWREYYRKRKEMKPWQMFGNVMPLATLQTGHRGNVFHVTPMWQQPGKVATCGADGYLRMGDVEASSGGDSSRSSIVISPEYFDDSDHMMSGLFSLRPGMCFSHHFLNANVGLLCSERGLRKFDTRLPPRQQERRALLGGGATLCKACAVWTVSSASSVEEVDSTYVFVGGAGAEVALCDLRMTGGDSSNETARVVCQYVPKGLKDNEEVSVSGLDLSRDKRELLVSYESDQIYTFPIFPNARSAAGPTVDEIDGLECLETSDDENEDTNGCLSMLNCDGRRTRSGEDIIYNELAAYGGHLNRFTFLKNAKYAGPNDEYICTGSDSGHAWIYERSSGAVVSLLNADHSTCNGVVPHPTLPIFITYGIDSTAKLWRGTPPVDPHTDDSASGRFRAFNEKTYEMSPLTRDWDTVEHELSNMEQELVEADMARAEDDSYDSDASESKSLLHSYNILPDQVLSRKELVSTGCFGRNTLRRFYAGTRIGNDLHSLPEILRRNQYECIRAAVGDSVGRRRDLPVESDLKELMRRVSLIRLRHQADRQGISGKWSAKLPWIFKKPESESAERDCEEDEDEDEDDKDPEEEPSVVCPHPADLVPDNPSDWIPYDPEMSKKYYPCGMAFNTDEYGVFYRERYLHSDRQLDSTAEPQPGPWRKNSDQEPVTESFSASEIAYKTLHETARVLKDGGNEALRSGDLDVAARRYDKAIRYCSVAFMSHHGASTYGGKYEEELMLISMKVLELDVKSEHNITPLMLKWSPLLKVLISTRLNLSMLLLKQAKHQKEVPQLEQAKVQARHALRELQPFCTRKGKVCMTFYKSGNITRICTAPVSGKSKVKTEVLKENEPEETYKEAKTLEAKAHFRLGSAQSDMNEYGEAIKSFDKSIGCTLELNPDAKLDPLVVRRLAEAKREKARQNKRHRKKFRMMFAQEEEAANKKTITKKCVTPCGKDGRRRTSALPMVSPSSPVVEDRGTQSE